MYLLFSNLRPRLRLPPPQARASTRRSFFAFVLCVLAVCGTPAIADSPKKSVVIFVCEHGSAKSVVAAAHFNRLVEQNKLPFVGISRGTAPDPEIAQPAIDGLRGDQIMLPPEKPAKLTASDASKALRVVSFCDLPKDIDSANVERWTVPPISEDYSKARDAILKNLQDLIVQLKNSQN